jgi:hypothetical protein
MHESSAVLSVVGRERLVWRAIAHTVHMALFRSFSPVCSCFVFKQLSGAALGALTFLGAQLSDALRRRSDQLSDRMRGQVPCQALQAAMLVHPGTSRLRELPRNQLLWDCVDGPALQGNRILSLAYAVH